MLKSIIHFKYLIDIILLLILSYFIYNTVVGNRGLLNYFTLQQKLPIIKDELNKLIAERESLDVKIKLLDINNVDIDFLDELARKDLGLIGKNEKCYITLSFDSNVF